MSAFAKAFACLLFGSSLAAATAATAQSPGYPAYPHKTVTLVTSSDAGGGGDVFLRELAKVLGPRWGINFVVENVPGSGGANAMRRIVEAPKDGSIFYGVSTQHIIVSLISDPPYKYTDLQPVVNLLYDAPIVYVLTDSPFKSLKDVTDFAKANPGKLKFGVGSSVSADRMAAETLKRQQKLDFVIATHDSGGANIMSLLGGAVDVSSGEVAEIEQHMQAGKVRPIAALMRERLPTLPDLPTAREQGSDVVLTRFRGIVGAKGLPADVVAAWEKAIALVLEDPEYKELVKKNGVIPAYLNSEDFDRVTNELAAETDSFFKEIGIKK